MIQQKIAYATAAMLLLFCLLAFKMPGAETGGQEPVLQQENGSDSADLETVRQRIVADLLEPAVDEKEIKNLIATIKPDGSWPTINYVDTSRTGFQHSIHLENMFDLARAYKKSNTPFYKNPEVKKTVSSALDFWIAHDFICANWWWNEMGTPNWMINTLLLLDDDLTPKQRTEGARIAGRASLTGFGARAGGDFVPLAGMVCKQGLFKRDEAILQNALQVMADQIKITTGRGIKPDLSFHHRVDNVISIHTYGTNYVSAFCYWAVKMAGTKYTLPPAALHLLIDYYLDGICKAMAFGTYPDLGAKNRDLSREGAQHAAGTDIPQNLVLASDYRKPELQNIIRIRKGEKKWDETFTRFFWHSEYFAHQRKDFFASVRMHSSRQNNMEEPYNEEGLKNHHFADGSNFITRSGKEYVDIFPVWDWQKIPGTTIMQKPSLPPPNQVAKKGLSGFVGAVTDGQYGAAAFDFKSVHDPLKARKAWFFFDREYVCLGAGITCEGDYPVVTTLNQCLLKGKVIIKTKKGLETFAPGQHIESNADWVWHDSVAYLFPTPVSINVSNMMTGGNWRQITHQSSASTDTVLKEVFTLWLNHGTKPRNETYAYLVLPGVGASQAEDFRKNNEVIILANTPQVQAVQNKQLRLSQIVFYTPGSFQLSEGLTLAADSACIVMVKMDTKGAVERLAVSDPTHQLTTLQLKITAPVQGSAKGWTTSWDKVKKMTTLQVDLPGGGEAGKSVVFGANNGHQ